MTVLLDISRPPRRHVQIAGISEPASVVVSIGRGKRRMLNIRLYRLALFIAVLGAFGAVAYLSPKFSGLDLSITPDVHAHSDIPNCSTARALGLAPAYRGQPGYRSHLDRDGDGISCEPYPRLW
jgi:hypothetical protein